MVAFLLPLVLASTPVPRYGQCLNKSQTQIMPLAAFALLLLLGIQFPPSARAQFQNFDALSDKKDCRIELKLPTGNFCGLAVKPEKVRGWYLDSGVFNIFVNDAEDVRKISVYFINAFTGSEFRHQLEIWSQKQRAGD